MSSFLIDFVVSFFKKRVFFPQSYLLDMFHEEGGSSTKTCQEGQIMEKKTLVLKNETTKSINKPSILYLN